jgi:hypothetical protein
MSQDGAFRNFHSYQSVTKSMPHPNKKSMSKAPAGLASMKG